MSAIIELDLIESTLRFVKQISQDFETYRVSRDHPIPVEEFSEFCRRRSEAEIQINIHPTASHVPGTPRGFYLAKRDGSYEIVVLRGQNRCWNRFVQCKEIFHVLLDQQDKEKIFQNANLREHIDQLMDGGMLKSSKSVQAEFLAEIAAMQLLFPHAHRVAQVRRDFSDIAEHYKIPRQKVEQFMQQTYLDTLQFPT